jgi:hypothetical protein
MPSHDDDDDDSPRSRGREMDDEGDDRPRKRRRRRANDDDDWERPRKEKSGGGTTVIIIVVVVGVVVLGCGGLGVLLLIPAISKVREAAARTQETNNLKVVGMGMLNHADANGGKFPDPDGNLSWRVELLPYIEQQNVYKSADLNQAWNAGRNQNLANILIPTYRSPLDDKEETKTHYRVFTGTGTAFDPDVRRRGLPAGIRDGTSNTILAVDTAEMVPWPQPKEIPFSPNGSLPELGHPNRSQGLILFCDGSVRSFDKKKKMDQKNLRAMITANGGEEVSLDW